MLLTTLLPARRSRIVILSVGTCVTLCSSASAAPTVVARQESEEPEPVAYRAAPLPPPAASKKSRDFTNRPRPTGAQAQTNVFFLNYDGVTLKYTGDDDAKKNETAFKEFAATYAPYGEGAKREASLQAVRADWAKYNVVITDERPQSGEYTMCVASPTNVFGGGVLGVAMLDCMDDHAASNVVLAFHSAKDKFSASTQATTISQEIAHAYGLEHVNEPMDIMNPYNAGGDPSFRDECLKLDSNAKVLCGAQHAQFCDGKKQNSHQELLWMFGAAEPDAVAPVVNIVEPQDGMEFQAPAELTIVAEASDNVAVEQVDILIDGIHQNAPV
ncbi:MAG TPA: Ig-like domain-containing protein, partial [Nannocystis sp.]